MRDCNRERKSVIKDSRVLEAKIGKFNSEIKRLDRDIDIN